MPRAARSRIGRRSFNANRVYNRRQRETSTKRSRRLEENRIGNAEDRLRASNYNAINLKSAFDYHSEIDYLNLSVIQNWWYVKKMY